MALSEASIAAPRRDQDLAMLIQRVARRDRSALAKLYDATNGPIFGLTVHMLGDQAAAEEVTLDLYLQVWRQAWSYDPRRGTPLAWLLALARRQAVDRLRAGGPERRHFSEFEIEQARPTVGEGFKGESMSASAPWETVKAAFDALPARQRQALELAYFGGLTPREIADRLHLPLVTIQLRLRLAVNRLRQEWRRQLTKNCSALTTKQSVEEE